MTMIMIGLAAGFVLGLLVVSLMNRNRTPKAFPKATPKATAEPVPGKGTMQEVEYYLRKDQKIYAIKAYREQHGCGLAEAKEAVEKHQRSIGI